VKVAVLAAIFASSKGFQPSISHSLLPQQLGVNHIGHNVGVWTGQSNPVNTGSSRECYVELSMREYELWQVNADYSHSLALSFVDRHCKG
jgi:hypothetical protein